MSENKEIVIEVEISGQITSFKDITLEGVINQVVPFIKKEGLYGWKYYSLVRDEDEINMTLYEEQGKILFDLTIIGISPKTDRKNLHPFTKNRFSHIRQVI